MERGTITSIAELQLIQQLWQEKINGPEDLTPQSRFARMLEEVEEARVEAENLNGSESSSKRLAGEVADVIFVALGLLSTLNASAETELNAIMDRNYRKYNPVVNQQLKDAGMTHREAMHHQKRIYTRPQK